MTYDSWKTDPDDIEDNSAPDEITDEREELYAEVERLRGINAELLAAAKLALRYCGPIYGAPMLGQVRAALESAINGVETAA